MTDYELNKAVAKSWYGYAAFKPILDGDFNPPRECPGIICMTECCETFSHDFLQIRDAWPIILEHKIPLNFETKNPIREAMETYLKRQSIKLEGPL
jgi:hypothetical protein